MNTYLRASLAVVVAALLSSCGGGKVSTSESSVSANQSKRLATASSKLEASAPSLAATWVQLPNPNYAPPAGPYARAWTEMTWDSLRQEVVIFGGNGPTSYENDIWAYSNSTTSWTEIDANVACPGNFGFSKPNGTDDSNFKYDPVNNLYWVFGANSGYRCLSYALVRTADAGSQGSTLVDLDLPATEAGAYTNWNVKIGDQTVSVLGFDAASKTLTLERAITGLGNGSNYQLYAHTGAGIWYFNPVDRTWVGQNTPSGYLGPIPTGARISPAVAYSDKDEAFVLFGGKATGYIDKQVWRLDVRSKLWTQLPLPPTGSPPHMRGLLNSLVYDKQNNVFVLFGGICYYDPSCTDSTNEGQTWVYHLPSNTWTNMNPPNSPSARSKHVMTYDEEHGVITLFGGLTNNGAADDTWVYHYPSNSWSKLSPSSPPERRYLAQMAYDPILKRSVLFGGQAPTGMRADIWALKLSAVANALPNVGVSSPAEGREFTAPASVTLVASASDSDGSVDLVEFFIGGLKAGEVTTAPYSLNLPNLAAGRYVVTAKATDNRGASAVSSPVNFTVLAPVNQAPIVNLSSPSDGSNYTAPANISLSASASDADGSISKVEYYLGSTKIGEASAAPYTFVWSNVVAGNYSLKARATDNSGATAESSAVNLTVNPRVNQAPSVSLTSPVSNSSYTSPASIQLTAMANDADGTIAKVEYFEGANKLGESTTAPFGMLWNNVSAGTYALTARATDNSGATSTSAAVTVGVSNPSSGVSVNVALASNGGIATASSSHSTAFPVGAVNDGNRKSDKWAAGGGWNDASPDAYPDWVQVNFNGVKAINRIDVVTLADNYATPTEPTQSLVFTRFGITKYQVQYWNGTTWITVQDGNVSGNNKVWRSFSFPAVSTDRIRVFVTESLYSYSRLVEVEAWSNSNEAPSVSLSSPALGTNFTAPASISLTASANDRDGSITKVEYFQGSTKIGEATAEPYRLLWSNVQAGTYSLTAKATDNAGATTTSAAISITVNPAPNQLPQVNLLSPTNGGVFTAPANITLSANASDGDGSIAKVEYFAGANKIGQSTVAPYSIAWPNVPTGIYRLSARATDNSGAFADSAAVSVTVNPAPNQLPQVNLLSPILGSTFIAPASITLSANANDADGTVTKVEYFDGVTKIGQSTVAPYSFTWTGVPAGSYRLKARATDNSGASSDSAFVAVTVSAPPNQAPIISLASPSNGSAFTAPAAINLSANASDTDGSVTKVEYFSGATKIGEASSAPFNVLWTNVAAGSYALTARATDNSGAVTNSVVVSVNVSNPPASTSVNVALAINGGVATASSSQSAAFPIRSINDGLRTAKNWANGGGWNDATQSTYPDWVQINFDSVKTIDRVVVVTLADNFSSATEPTPSTAFSQYGITEFQVQYWNGTAWLAIPGGSISANRLVMKSIGFPAVSTDRIRVVITASLYWYSRVVEVEAWSATGP